MNKCDYEVLRVPRENVSDDMVLVNRWNVKNGQKVKKGDLIVELETSKTAFEVEAPTAGYLFYKSQEGEQIRVGGLLAVISKKKQFSFNAIKDEVAGLSAVSRVNQSSGEAVRFSKGALQLIEEHRLDKSVFSSAGMVTRKDVMRYLNGRNKSAAPELLQYKTFESNQKVLILGAGGHAGMCIDILRQMKTFAIAGIATNDRKIGDKVFGVPVIGNDNELKRYYDEQYRFFINGIGAVDNHPFRWELYRRLKQHGFFIPNIIHPSASVEPSATMGEGNQIMAHAVVGSHVRIANNCIVNSGAIVSHNCMLHDNVHVTPGAILAGWVEIGRNTLIGMGATIYTEVRIGNDVLIHNGCRVTRDVPNGSIVKVDNV